MVQRRCRRIFPLACWLLVSSSASPPQAAALDSFEYPVPETPLKYHAKVDLDSDSLPPVTKVSEGKKKVSTSASTPQAVAIEVPEHNRMMVISEGEIQRLKKDLKGLSSTVDRLTQELDGLCTPLVDLSETEDPTITAKCWMKQVREVCYDTGDYLHDVLRSGAEFKILEARAKNASETLRRYGIQSEAPSIARLLPGPHGDLIDHVHKDMVDKVEHLMGTDKDLKVVSIFGPEGVGKTTLVKRLYHRRHIGGSGSSGTLDCWAFVRVSAKPDILRLLTSIFIQIQGKPPSCHLDAHGLIGSIAGYLEKKRYFIIIDDIWTAEVWDTIRPAFLSGSYCSRIITTTQIEGVALACCGHQSRNIFKMEPLNDIQSKNLFFWIVYGSKTGCPRYLKKVSNAIIRKCGGLPLATINIASMLPSRMSLKEWTGIRDSLPSARSANLSSEWMKEVVTLMYSTLRPHLKTCLLYFSMYPVGWNVRKDDLVKQWLVEGILDRFVGQETEEILGGYFDELVRRGMIQPVNTNKNGEVLSCTLHRVIHDVIVNKSMEENFVITMDYFQSGIPLADKVRRLSVQFVGARSAHIPDSLIMSKVRSLAYFGLFQCLPSIDEYRILRVLILHIRADQDKDCIDLAGIRELLRLRYLKIECNVAVELPNEMQGLQYLETLEVDATVAAIPWDIGELTGLRILKFAVSELSSEDICVLQELVALTALTVYVKTAPTEKIVFGKGGFSDLKFFTLRCGAPLLLIEENAMPNIQKLNLCYNSHNARQDGSKPITIRSLASVQEISVKIWGAVADAGSALAHTVTNDARNPTPFVQLKRGTLEGHDDIREEGCDDGWTEKDEHREADSRKPSISDTRGLPSHIASFADSRKMGNLLTDLPDGHVSFKFFKDITNNFSEVIGTPDVFGAVYKGNVKIYGDIAVKKHVVNAPWTSDDREEYRDKAQKITENQHGNITKLLAFCLHRGAKVVRRDGNVHREIVFETVFCYEYFSNGNLHSLLYGNPPNNLSWDKRFKIIKGICRGLWSLHSWHEPIIHLNLKPKNIVLDENMVPKITDFMYWRMFGEDKIREYTKNEVESIGYKAPEYLEKGEISCSTDIYSLGLMILEITTRKNSPSEKMESSRKYFEEVEETWNDKTRKESILSWYKGLDSNGCHEVDVCIKIGLSCVKLAADERPDIAEIVRDLNAL